MPRTGLMDIIGNGAEKYIGFLNWIGGGKNWIKYYYDEVILWTMTRYEIALWIVYAIIYYIKRALDNCRDK